MEQKQQGISLPGFAVQYPETWQATVSFCVLCFTVVLLPVALLNWSDSEKFNTLAQGIFTRYRITANGSDAKLTVLKQKRQFQFMTPSVGSWSYRKQETGYDTLSDQLRSEILLLNKWEMIDSNKVREFGDLLVKNDLTKGFRRYLYHGQGRFENSVGWWWVITVDEDVDIRSLVRSYCEFWGTNDVYLEELSASGGFSK